MAKESWRTSQMLRAWALFFVVLGSNSIFIYMARHFINFNFTTHYFFDGAIRSAGAYKSLLWAIAVVFVEWLLLFLLYKKRIFLRV
jgi:predicted acyltransferase